MWQQILHQPPLSSLAFSSGTELASLPCSGSGPFGRAPGGWRQQALQSQPQRRLKHRACCTAGPLQPISRRLAALVTTAASGAVAERVSRGAIPIPGLGGDDRQAGDSAAELPPNTSVTDRVWMDVALCSEMPRGDRTLGDSAICNATEPLGRLVIGLYGEQVPQTVESFKKAVTEGTYNGTVFFKVFPGKFIKAGRQGSTRMGDIEPPRSLPVNADTLSSASYRLEHRRAGTVSLSLSENDDDWRIRSRSNYRNLQFLITTGPGPTPSLDGTNIVFGRVLEGLDTVSAVARVPTFKPSERIRFYNSVARFLGDGRAEQAQRQWGKPLQPVLITGSGIMT
ncbi:hypothetical protein WJX84_012172 [Apatococcus fuscideae]|uniref:PPIase cyclophilin-type domain-containing protein n=1 Tax=Apatococcus fuscideae TaxID=2026836 RepID=A0AAW1T693_9CHLO